MTSKNHLCYTVAMKIFAVFCAVAYLYILLNSCYGKGSANFQESFVVTSLAKGERYGGTSDGFASDFQLALDALKTCVSPFETLIRAGTGGYINSNGVSEPFPKPESEFERQKRLNDPWAGTPAELKYEAPKSTMTPEEIRIEEERLRILAIKELKRIEDEEKENAKR